MKLFVSWSGEASRRAAELFKDWLPFVIQEADVWVSSQDISKGDRWSTAIWENLSEIDFGVLMVTKANADAPWLMFEAGALSKSIKSKVIPILCDVDRLQIADTPLSQFQDAQVTKEDIFNVVVAVNTSCVAPLDAIRLRAIFEKWWPDFEAGFKKLDFGSVKPNKKTPVADADRLDRIEAGLESVIRTLQGFKNNNLNIDRRLRELRHVLPPESFRWTEGRWKEEAKEDYLNRITDEYVRLVNTVKTNAQNPADGSAQVKPEQ